jgi:hypothetical protein
MSTFSLEHLHSFKFLHPCSCWLWICQKEDWNQRMNEEIKVIACRGSTKVSHGGHILYICKKGTHFHILSASMAFKDYKVFISKSCTSRGVGLLTSIPVTGCKNTELKSYIVFCSSSSFFVGPQNIKTSKCLKTLQKHLIIPSIKFIP